MKSDTNRLLKLVGFLLMGIAGLDYIIWIASDDSFIPMVLTVGDTDFTGASIGAVGLALFLSGKNSSKLEEIIDSFGEDEKVLLSGLVSIKKGWTKYAHGALVLTENRLFFSATYRQAGSDIQEIDDEDEIDILLSDIINVKSHFFRKVTVKHKSGLSVTFVHVKNHKNWAIEINNNIN